MNADERETFVRNRAWFNEFFDGVKQLFERAADLLSSEWALPFAVYLIRRRTSSQAASVLHPGARGRGIRGSRGNAIDPTLILRPSFVPEPSFVVVKHADGDRHLYFTDYAEYVLGSGPLIEAAEQGATLSGRIPGRARFHAFQVGFEHFASGRDLHLELEGTVVQRLRSLPPFPTVS